MWLATKFGFFSVVQNTNPTRRKDEVVAVRARVKRDLQLLGKAMWKFPAPIVTLKNSDYRYRIEIAANELQNLMTLLAAEVDYDNFKGMIGKSPTQKDKLPGYHEMWQQARYWQMDEAVPKTKNKKRNKVHKVDLSRADQDFAQMLGYTP
jgi:hypothetical protein